MVTAALGRNVTLECPLGRDSPPDRIGITLRVDEQTAPTRHHLMITDKAGGRCSIFLSKGAEDPVLDTQRLSATITATDAIFLSLRPSSLKALPLIENARAPIHLDLHMYDG